MDRFTKISLIYAHGTIMVIVWLIAVPFAIAANMYARKRQLSWGPRVHMIIMLVTVPLLFLTSVVAAFSVVGKLEPKPHSVIAAIKTKKKMDLLSPLYRSLVLLFVLVQEFK